MKILTCLVAAFLAGATVAAFAAEQTIKQKGKMFSERAITVKKGEKVTFVNDDNVAHNIFSTSSGNDFNLGLLTPGSSASVAFDKAGNVDVICAIHPQMKMKVTVTD